MDSLSRESSGNADAYGNTPLHQACINGQGEVVKAMLAKGDIDLNARNDEKLTPLFMAVMSDNLLIADLLLEAGADPNISGADGNSPCTLRQAMKMSIS